jgi:hypothetical protein
VSQTGRSDSEQSVEWVLLDGFLFFGCCALSALRRTGPALLRPSTTSPITQTQSRDSVPIIDWAKLISKGRRDEAAGAEHLETLPASRYFRVQEPQNPGAQV